MKLDKGGQLWFSFIPEDTIYWYRRGHMSELYL